MIAKRTISIILAITMLLSFMAGINMTAGASIAEDAESYELGNWVKWKKGWQEDGDRCFEFYISEKSYVTIDCVRYGDFRTIEVYNNAGKAVIRNDEFSLKYNKVKDSYRSNSGKVLNKGTYYLATAFGGADAECSLRIQAEKYISLPKGKISVLKSKKKGQMTVAIEKVNNAIGYIIIYSTDEAFKKNVKTIKTFKTKKTIKKTEKRKALLC